MSYGICLDMWSEIFNIEIEYDKNVKEQKKSYHDKYSVLMRDYKNNNVLKYERNIYEIETDPTDTYTYIITKESIKNYAKQINKMIQLKSAFTIYKDKMVKAKRMYDLITKYKYYSDREIFTNSLLLDALFAGCTLPYASSSVKTYDSTVENDIKDIIKYFPKSIIYNYGTLRCRDCVTPIVAAIANSNIPLDIIELLLKHGSDPLQPYLTNKRPVLIIDELQENMLSCDNEKIENILVLIKKYTK